VLPRAPRSISTL